MKAEGVASVVGLITSESVCKMADLLKEPETVLSRTTQVKYVGPQGGVGIDLRRVWRYGWVSESRVHSMLCIPVFVIVDPVQGNDPLTDGNRYDAQAPKIQRARHPTRKGGGPIR